MQRKLFKSVKWIVMVYLFIHVILPLFALIGHISVEDINDVLSSPQFLPMLGNSLLSTSIATVVAVCIALMLAWCVNRTGIRWKSIWTVLFTLPMLIPSISHGMSLTLLFGDNGIFTNLTGINIHLYGLTGIVIGATLYSFPVAFLMLTDIFQYEDYTTYEVAEVMGIPKSKQFFKITLSNLKKPLISTIFAVFTMIFTDYGVPLVVGGKMMTLPVYMYREVIGLLNYSAGGIIGVILLFPTAVAFIIDLLNKTNTLGNTVTKRFVIKENKKRDVLSYVFCSLILILACLPILVFVVLSFVKQYPIDYSFTFDNIYKSLELGVGGYLLNSLFIGLAAALVGTIVAYYSAYVTARSKKSFSNLILHLFSIISLSMPGIVLGLSYVLLFQGSFVYGTLIMLITVNITHFFASPYLMAYNSLQKFNNNLEDVAYTLGVNKMKMLFDVYIPSTRGTILEMFSYFFVNCMVTVSAVSFLANFRNMPLSLLIPQFDSQSLVEPVAFISITILVVNIIAKGIIFLLKMYFQKKEAA